VSQEVPYVHLTRTRNPLLAKQVRYLLRHGPLQSFPCGRSVAAEDETRIRRAPFMMCTVCANQAGGTVHSLLSDGTE
jgi:hypothetical protein